MQAFWRGHLSRAGAGQRGPADSPASIPQPKQFRKMIQQTFQQYALLREEECILKFLNTLAAFTHIDQETYRCELVVSPCPAAGSWGVGLGLAYTVRPFIISPCFFIASCCLCTPSVPIGCGLSPLCLYRQQPCPLVA